jgi:hypothetical protein
MLSSLSNRDAGLKMLCIMNSSELGKVAHAEHIFAEGSGDWCEVLNPAGFKAWAQLQYHTFANGLDAEWWRTSFHNSLSVHCLAAREPVQAERASPVWELITKQQMCSLVPQTNFSCLRISRNYAKTRGCRSHGLYQRQSTKIIQHLV